MALDKAALIIAIQDIKNIDYSSGAIENDLLAAALADAIEAYVESGEVIVATGSSAGTYKVT